MKWIAIPAHGCSHINSADPRTRRKFLETVPWGHIYAGSVALGKGQMPAQHGPRAFTIFAPMASEEAEEAEECCPALTTIRPGAPRAISEPAPLIRRSQFGTLRL